MDLLLYVDSFMQKWSMSNMYVTASLHEMGYYKLISGGELASCYP
jgi:hypothetical protein